MISVGSKLQKSDAGPLKIIAYNEKRYTNNTLKNQTLSITIHVKVNDFFFGGYHVLFYFFSPIVCLFFDFTIYSTQSLRKLQG